MDKLFILQKAFGEYQKVGKEYMFFCPNKCHETKRKLSINLEKNVYKCWICGDDLKGNDIKFLLLKYAKQLVGEWCSLEPEHGRIDFSEDIEESGWKFTDWGKWNRFLAKEWDKQSPKILEYLNRKKITKENALLWGIRVSSAEKDTLLIPSFGLDGEVTYFSKRKFFGDVKFFKPRAPFEIFNEFWLDFSGPIYLVENAFDAVRFPISQVMPLLGSELSKYNSFINKCIANETTINIFLDVDAEAKEHKIYQNLIGYGLNVNRVNNIFKKDIEDLEDWQLNICKNTFVKSSDVLLNYVRSKLG